MMDKQCYCPKLRKTDLKTLEKPWLFTVLLSAQNSSFMLNKCLRETKVEAGKKKCLWRRSTKKSKSIQFFYKSVVVLHRIPLPAPNSSVKMRNSAWLCFFQSSMHWNNTMEQSKPQVTVTLGNRSNFVGEFWIQTPAHFQRNRHLPLELSAKSKEQNASRQFSGPVKLPKQLLEQKEFSRSPFHGINEYGRPHTISTGLLRLSRWRRRILTD